MGVDPLSPEDRRALTATAAQFFANGAMTASFVARAPQIRDNIGVTIDDYGLLLSVAAVVGLIGSLLAGRVVHALGTRRLLVLGAVVMVATLPIIGGARSPAVWFLGMVPYVFVDVFVDISMNMQGSWLSARRHTPVMNRLHGVWSLGLFTGGGGAVLANAAGMTPLVHLSLVAAVMAVALAVVTRHLLRVDEDAHADTAVDTPTATTRSRLLPLVLLVLAAAFAVVGEVTGGEWAAFRLADDFGAAAALASGAFVAYSVGMTAMRFVGDSLQVRLGDMGLHRLSVGLALVGVLLAALVPSPIVSVVGFTLVGSGVATFMPKLYDDAARVPGRRGAGMGAMTAGLRTAFLFTPVAVGSLAGTALSVGDAIAILTVPALVGLAIVTEANDRILHRRRSPDPTP